VNITAASATHFAKCILLHANSRNYSSQRSEHKQKHHIAYLTSWHNIFLVIN